MKLKRRVLENVAAQRLLLDSARRWEENIPAGARRRVRMKVQ